jgi:hypothetical protein
MEKNVIQDLLVWVRNKYAQYNGLNVPSGSYIMEIDDETDAVTAYRSRGIEWWRPQSKEEECNPNQKSQQCSTLQTK